MRGTIAGLRSVFIVVIVVATLVAINSCGGGGSAPLPDDNQDPNPNLAVSQFGYPDSAGRLIDTESNYEDGSKTTIGIDQQVNITVQLFGRDIQHGNQRGRLEITNATVDAGSPMINGVQGRFVATMGGANIATAGNGRFVVSFSGHDISALAPNGDWVDVTVGFEVIDEWFGRMLVELNGFTVPPTERPQPDSNGDGRPEWRAFGALGVIALLAAIFPCPDDYETYKFRVEPGGLVPPPATSLSANGPGSAAVGTIVTINVASNCPNGWTATWPGGNHSGNGNGSFTTVMPAHDLTVVVNDGCGHSVSVTVVLENNPPPTNEPPVARLVVSPDHGTAPLSVTLDASASTDSDGTIVKYEWDYDGSGSWDFDSGADAVVSHSYGVGTWTPRVRVTDNDGATAIAVGATVIVTNPPIDQYAGATVFITPQSPFLDPEAGDEQQFIARIYASDGLTELPLPSGASTVWSSDPTGLITQTGYFYSVYAPLGAQSATVTCTISWTGHALSGMTTVWFVPQG